MIDNVPNPSEHNQWYPFLDRPMPNVVDGIMANPAVILVTDADSNPGFKMIGVGKLTAQMLVYGEKPWELEPFSVERYTNGTTFGDRISNCPWV